MIGVYIIGGFVILLLLAIYGAINRTSKELKGIFLAILSREMKNFCLWSRKIYSQRVREKKKKQRFLNFGGKNAD